MNLKRLRSHELIDCSSDILSERESQADATVTENYLLQTEGHQTDMFPEDYEHVDIATSPDNLVEDITNEHQATIEELTTNEEQEEISNADNQAEISSVKAKIGGLKSIITVAVARNQSIAS